MSPLPPPPPTHTVPQGMCLIPQGKTITPERALPLPNIFLRLFSCTATMANACTEIIHTPPLTPTHVLNLHTTHLIWSQHCARLEVHAAQMDAVHTVHTGHAVHAVHAVHPAVHKRALVTTLHAVPIKQSQAHSMSLLTVSFLKSYSARRGTSNTRHLQHGQETQGSKVSQSSTVHLQLNISKSLHVPTAPPPPPPPHRPLLQCLQMLLLDFK